MSKRSLSLIIEDIWESIEKIERYTIRYNPGKFSK